MRIILNNVLVEDKKALDDLLKRTSLNKAIIARQIFKKFLENTEDTIDFLFK